MAPCYHRARRRIKPSGSNRQWMKVGAQANVNKLRPIGIHPDSSVHHGGTALCPLERAIAPSRDSRLRIHAAMPGIQDHRAFAIDLHICPKHISYLANPFAAASNVRYPVVLDSDGHWITPRHRIGPVNVLRHNGPTRLL